MMLNIQNYFWIMTPCMLVILNCHKICQMDISPDPPGSWILWSSYYLSVSDPWMKTMHWRKKKVRICHVTTSTMKFVLSSPLYKIQ